MRKETYLEPAPIMVWSPRRSPAHECDSVSQHIYVISAKKTRWIARDAPLREYPASAEREAECRYQPAMPLTRVRPILDPSPMRVTRLPLSSVSMQNSVKGPQWGRWEMNLCPRAQLLCSWHHRGLHVNESDWILSESESGNDHAHRRTSGGYCRS